MCADPPGVRLPRIAFCACGAEFVECDLRFALRHITLDSSSSHRWAWVRSDIKMFDAWPTEPREIHNYKEE